MVFDIHYIFIYLISYFNEVKISQNSGNAEHNPPRREAVQHTGEHWRRHQAVRLLNQRATDRQHSEDQGRGLQAVHGAREDRAHHAE